MPSQDELNKMAKQFGMQPMPTSVRPTIREQLKRQIEIGERAKEALEVFDNNPIIQTFLNKIEQT